MTRVTGVGKDATQARELVEAIYNKIWGEMTFTEAAALIDSALLAARLEAVEKCKAKIMSGSFLSTESPDYEWAQAVCKRLDDLKEAPDADAEQAESEARALREALERIERESEDCLIAEIARAALAAKEGAL